MVAVPADVPVTTPVAAPTAATAALLLLHVPPATASVRVAVVPVQTVVAPVMVPAVAAGLTVMVRVLLTAPHAAVTV